MRKIICLSLVALPLFACNLTGRQKPAEQARFESDLAALAAQSAADTSPCEGFGNSFASFVSATQNEILREKEKLAELIDLVGKYPGTPDSTLRAVARVTQGLPPGADWDISGLTQLNTCRMTQFQSAVRMAVLTTRALQPGPEAHGRLLTAVFSAIKRELRATSSMASVLGAGLVMQTLIDGGILPVSDAIYVEFARLLREVHEQRDAITELWKQKLPDTTLDPKKLDAKKRKAFNEVVIQELQRADRLRSHLAMLFARMEATLLQLQAAVPATKARR